MTSTTAARCHIQTASSPPSLFQNGQIVIQVHHVGWLVSGIFTLIATVTSAWLIINHLRWYTIKCEQRHIVRILFMVPIYAIVSFASYLFWNHSTPLLLLRDCYESIVVTAFFYLLLMYLSHDPEEQRRFFVKYGLSCEADEEARARGEPVKKWVFPLQFVKWKPRDGLYFLQLMKYGILQYTVVRPVTTLIAIILDYLGLYCESSWSPRWGHIYLSVTVSISVTIAMYCLIQLYISVSKPLAPHQPLLKLFSIKAVVFLTFWQESFLSLLSTFGVVKNTKYMTADDIDIGIGALLETFEMMLFAFLHIKAFSYRPYKRSLALSTNTLLHPTPRLHSLFHAMDFRETCIELWAGCVYLFDKARGREPSADRRARRAEYYENAFPRPRPPQRSPRVTEKASSSRSLPPRSKSEKVSSPPKGALYVQVEREIDVDGQRQWLGTGNDYIYGLGFMHGERSASLELEFERELAKRGYGPSRALPQQPPDPEPLNSSVRPTKKEKRGPQLSWWRSFYRRLSQSDPDAGEQIPVPPPKPRQSRSRLSPRSSEHNVPLLNNLDDLPPRSILGTYQRQQKEEQKNHSPRGTDDGDVLMPLPVFQDSRFAGLSSPGRSAYRQMLVSVDRESTSSSPAPKHPFPCVEGSQGYLAPTSSRASRYSRDDSLLGRLFHDNLTEGDSMSMTDFGTIGDGTQSILSISTDRVGQAKKTPLARLTTTTPQIMTRGTVTDTPERRALLQSVPEQTQPSPELPDPLVAEILPGLNKSLDQTQARREERIATIHRRPLPTPPTSGILPGPTIHSPGVEKPPVADVGPPTTRTIRHRISRDDLDILPKRQRHPAHSHDLSHNNARTRSRAITSPALHSYGVPRVPEETHTHHFGRPPSGASSPGSISPGQTLPSQSSSLLLKPVTQPRKSPSSTRDISYQTSSEARGYSHSGSLSPESNTMPSRHRTRDPPTPQSRANPSHHSLSPPHSPSQMNPPPSPSSPRALRPRYNHAAKPFTSLNRLRKHEGKHGRSSSDIPSRTSQATSSTSRSPTNSPSSYAARNWRTMDYPSTSWYLPANPDS